MKLGGGCLIALGIFMIWSMASEIVLEFATQPGRFIFNWHDFCLVAGYIATGALLTFLGVTLWRRKPKSWFW